MVSVAHKRRAFRALHEQGCFVMPNPWDIGTARPQWSRIVTSPVQEPPPARAVSISASTRRHSGAL